jgi:hypothetical protein
VAPPDPAAAVKPALRTALATPVPRRFDPVQGIAEPLLGSGNLGPVVAAAARGGKVAAAVSLGGSVRHWQNSATASALAEPALPGYGVGMTPQAFIAKWHASTRNERAAAQEHFLDLWALLAEPPQL